MACVFFFPKTSLILYSMLFLEPFSHSFIASYPGLFSFNQMGLMLCYVSFIFTTAKKSVREFIPFFSAFVNILIGVYSFDFLFLLGEKSFPLQGQQGTIPSDSYFINKKIIQR